jgi:hypothetical protein
LNNAQKTPLSRTLTNFTQRKAIDEIQKRGMALPGTVLAVSGGLVTVNFEVTGATVPNVTMPVFGPEYIRYPIQPGDKGVAFPASVYIGQVSGLGAPAATADLTTLYGNLSALVWFPIANKNWTVPPGSDANTLALYGHLATLLLDSLSGNSSIKLAATGISLNFGSATITLNSSGITLSDGGHSIVINSSGVIIDDKVFLTHVHTLVQSGSSDSGPVGP